MTNEQIDRLLATFSGGLVKQTDPANPRGYTMRYRPRDAMRAVIAEFGNIGADGVQS